MKVVSLSSALSLIVLGCLSTAASAADLARPATIHLTVTDAAGKPVAAAAAQLTADPQPGIARVTDAQGTAELSMPSAGPPAWQARLSVKADGFMADEASFVLFPGAQMDRHVTLKKRTVTTIHVTGPDGKPVARAPLAFRFFADGREERFPGYQFRPAPSLTDAHGDYLWEHRSAPDGFDVVVSTHSAHGTDAAPMTILLTPAEFAALQPARTLAGRLFLSDGTPAKDWCVALGDGTSLEISGGYLFSQYQATKLIPVNADGTFELDAVAAQFFVISPQGLPLFYTLDPSAWDEPVRHVSITLPAFQPGLSGQVSDEAGKPIPNLPLFVGATDEPWRSWSLSVADLAKPFTFGQHLPGGVTTDAQGRFALPAPPGADVNLQTEQGRNLVRKSPDKYTLAAEPPSLAPPRYKELLLHVVDEAGQPVTDVSPVLHAKTPGVADASAVFDLGRAEDRAGFHFFLKPFVAAVEVTLNGPAWGTVTRSFSLAGEGDQQETLVLADSLRLKPIDGRVLDPDGRPVAHALVTPVVLDDKGQESTWASAGPVAYTDGDGRFHIAGAADECALTVARYDATGDAMDLPGWRDPIPVRAEARRAEIKLQPAGQVHVRLPAAWGRSPQYPTLEDTHVPRNAVNRYVTLHFLADTHEFVASSVAPGSYRASVSDFPDFPDLAERPIDVKSGESTVIDLAAQSLSGNQAQRWATVKVMAGGKPYAGAQVAVFTDQFAPDDVKKWIEEWRTAQPARRAELQTRLAAAAGTALDQLDALHDPALADLRGAIDKPPNLPLDGLSCQTEDLSDVAAAVRFKGQIGREYVAVAQVRGQYLGWQRFTLAPAAADPPVVTIKPTRTVVLPRGSNSQIVLQFADPAGIERRALMRVFYPSFDNVLGPSQYMRYGISPRGNEPRPTFPDLPVDTEFRFVQSISGHLISPATFGVKAGDGPQEIDASLK